MRGAVTDLPHTVVADARLLAGALADPGRVMALDAEGWTALLTIARAEQLIGTLALRLDGLPLPRAVEAILGDARAAAEQGRRAALWEAEMARRALAPLGCPVVLLKGRAGRSAISTSLCRGRRSTGSRRRCSARGGNG
jgi:hypothetical protein